MANDNDGSAPTKTVLAGEPETQEPPTMEVMFAGWVGPLPPPAMLKQFAEVVPDGAERIYRQFELEAEHRRAQERRDIAFQIRFAHAGQALALLFVAAVLGVVWLTAKEAPTVASILAGGTIVSGIIAFLQTKKQEPKE